MCPGLRTETLWMQEELFPPFPSLLLLLCAVVAGGQARLPGGQQAKQWGAPPGAAGPSAGQDAGGQRALTPPQEQDTWGLGGAGVLQYLGLVVCVI